MAKTLSHYPHLLQTSFLLNPLRTLLVVKPQIQRRSSLFFTRAMRAVVQRVSSASVEVDGQIVSKIGPGYLVLVGILESDTDSDSDYICRKVLNMRLFPNETTGKSWDQSVMQRNYEVLLVSQFTLYGILKGNKPDFHVAMPPLSAKPFYESLVEKFRKSYKADMVKDGIFGAMMKVNLVNDGPVTMQLESPQPSKNKNDAEEKRTYHCGYLMSMAFFSGIWRNPNKSLYSCGVHIYQCNLTFNCTWNNIMAIFEHK